MKQRKHVGFLLALVVLILMPMSVSAQQWASEDFTVELPEDYYIFTPEISQVDPMWSEAGISEPSSITDLFGDGSSGNFLASLFGGGSNNQQAAMHGIACFVGDDGNVRILVTRRQSAESYEIYNLKDHSREEQLEFMENNFRLNEEAMGDLENSGYKSLSQEPVFYEDAEVPFIAVHIDAVTSEDKELHEIAYMTVLNGYSVSFNTFITDGEIPLEAESLITELVQSFHVTSFTDPADNALTTEDIIKLLVFVIVVAAVIVTAVIVVRRRGKKDKRQKKEMADRLSEYHRQRSLSDNKGRLCFANVTKCSDEAIHSFCIYHAYIKNMISMIVGVVSCIVLLVITIGFSREWFMILISVALTVYYAFKIITASSSLEKVQKKVYARGSSDMAKYAFYENEFRVSGIQSVGSYPYFQITDVKENKGYVYLYYGPENAYIVSENGFANNVSSADFVDFIKNKVKEGTDDK